MLWFIRMTPLFAVFWLVLSGHFSLMFLSLGVLSIALVCWVSWRAELPDHESISPRLVVRLPLFFLWLGKEVLVTSLAVVRQIWSPRLVLRPVVQTTPAADMTVLSQVIYANSITLTPGTLSLDVTDDHVEVHALRAADIEGVESDAMLHQVRRLEVDR